MTLINNFKEAFFLEEYEQKAKLIELLIIIGTLIFAFKIPEELNFPFLIFLSFSILYFIVIQKKEDAIQEYVTQINVLAVIVSASFSGILAYSMGVAGTNNISILSLKIGSFVVMYVVYSLFFTAIIWSALSAKNTKKS